MLGRVSFCRVFNVDQQARVLNVAADMMTRMDNVLLVVDGAMALYRADYSGRGELAQRQMHLAQFLRKLLKLADEFGAVVLVTNQVVADIANGPAIFGTPNIPAGGNIMAHGTNTRLSLRRGRGETRVCKIYKSPTLPESECVFAIKTIGICDADE